MQADHKEILDTAHEMADAARQAILPHFRRADLVEDNKLAGGYDPVTLADRAAEQAMREVLARRRPQDAILGEEYGQVAGESGLTWVLDPIDGTRGFVSGTPTWGVLIGLNDGEKILMGMVDQPYTGERFWGGFGAARMTGPLGERELATRATAALEEAVIFTTFPEVGTPREAEAFRTVASRCKLTRYGMDCYAYALIAAGQVDLVIEAGLHPYDIQGPIGVIEAAGGLVTDWRGNPVLGGGQVIAAANPRIHRLALDMLGEYAE
ncbi:myo-inositol-1(or 4)-monophosphatase [Pseudooceanicola antarcticus]|uniref:Histidinol-phosphatase n=1 Tax=Pseudooceanicola antarcticus TaxID=1247613 RepID=A0A285IGR3_9RHOB|nr:histidinol-phosphatase [Pseudooceanicola antarcticus]PJE29019.1 histidinol-phosphatase [Pseudooceanicola antarcticus]SNY47190.1 myo-inositol-1(or 4)-monophosphatase [Pseudooceanicola antarcticus]